MVLIEIMMTYLNEVVIVCQSPFYFVCIRACI